MNEEQTPMEGEEDETAMGRNGETASGDEGKDEAVTGENSDAAKEGERRNEEEAGPIVVTSGRPRTTGRIRTLSDREFEHETRMRSRRAFMIGGAAMLAGFGGWRWLVTRQEEDGALWPFRRVLETNERLARDYFADTHLAKTYPRSMAVMPRVNGVIGMQEPLDLAKWRLRVIGLAVPPRAAMTRDTTAVDSTDVSDEEFDDSDSLYLTIDDIRSLPRTEMVTELRCIEGWSVVVQWGGVRFRDFAAKYRTQSGGAVSLDRGTDPSPYVSLETPNGGYYVGLDTASAMHPQTLLCYEMNGRPLTAEHGAPLRLVVPAKYGVKNIKRIGMIRFTGKRPADYWAEQGYDWYAGL
jgi:hypothetical protein